MNKKLLDLMIEEHETEFKEAIKLRDEAYEQLQMAKTNVINLNALYNRHESNASLLELNLNNLKCINIEKEDGN